MTGTGRVEKTKPTRRERNLAEIRKQGCVRAEQIVLEEGLSALSARGLATDLKISVGSLYNAFGDLDGLVQSVVIRFTEQLACALQKAVETAPNNDKERLTAMGEAYLNFALSEPRRWSALFGRELGPLSDPYSQALQEKLLETLVIAGGGDPNSPVHREFFVLLWASVHGLVSLAVRPTISAIDPEVARKHIRTLVETGYKSFPKG